MTKNTGKLISETKTFCPGHITGFFEKPQKKTQNNLYYGSRGSGFSLKKGISTIVKIYESSKTNYNISINGSRNVDTEVSTWVVNEYIKYIDNNNYFIDIDHKLEIPIGFGLGTSGSAALSLSYALNDSLSLGFDRFKAAQIAHNADIICNTGLGTVIAEFYGGFEIRKTAGGPGIGIVEKIPINNYKAIILCLNPISTQKILNQDLDDVNYIGNQMIERISISKNIEEFLIMSHYFSDLLKLTQGVCSESIKRLNSNGFECAVALFGETVFTIVRNNEVDEIKRLFSDYSSVIVSDIDNNGVRILESKK